MMPAIAAVLNTWRDWHLTLIRNESRLKRGFLINAEVMGRLCRRAARFHQGLHSVLLVWRERVFAFFEEEQVHFEISAEHSQNEDKRKIAQCR